MKLSISNIAWADDSQVIETLIERKIEHVDLALSKYFSFDGRIEESSINEIADYWSKNGIQPLGTQSLFYGKPELNLFYDEQSRRLMLAHLESYYTICNKLGIKYAVFGSPKNRFKGSLTEEESLEVSLSFFKDVAALSQKYKIITCLEPNPTIYSCDFLTSTTEVIDFIKLVKHDALKVQIDIGAMCVNKEEPDEIFSKAQNNIGYVHISEPGLKALSVSNSYHYLVSSAMKRNNTFEYDMCIEIALGSKADPIDDIARSIDFVLDRYF
ncbi:sugar phosphate isomerase/epimerase family protein [Vibrio caribbeanicus]|uniref:sugar phosphate isomerase/epimerase family protein n=1 Tax=Vibrio caribbeanicus TaxID=701175 RepID=UPI0022843794|nr:TIM barrel protein [Vibrio caribbeanicus]MCY9844246.1 TIM barrel protein [Vibrio caribbeanicus]